ncbi:MAG: 23S rRNA (pseudouridine(1915)-N(3))-methyltransferase RlmH [Mogibacterium sp.]|nr:23S rRNA (pseudouridine(1915)-N(3))-methyltransferase RlmH [Mogibacterium sp.]
MNINIICIGKLKEKYWQDAAAEYLKRLGGYCNVRVVELKEAKLPANAGARDEEIVMEKEGEAILAKVAREDYVIAMAVEGRQLDSIAFARTLSGIFTGTAPGGAGKGSYQTVDFVIGGSLGLSPAVKRRADRLLSFSPMTFPHQLARVMLLEQIYRAFKINAGETYHK